MTDSATYQIRLEREDVLLFRVSPSGTVEMHVLSLQEWGDRVSQLVQAEAEPHDVATQVAREVFRQEQLVGAAD